MFSPLDPEIGIKEALSAQKLRDYSTFVMACLVSSNLLWAQPAVSILLTATINSDIPYPLRIVSWSKTASWVSADIFPYLSKSTFLQETTKTPVLANEAPNITYSEYYFSPGVSMI